MEGNEEEENNNDGEKGKRGRPVERNGMMNPWDLVAIASHSAIWANRVLPPFACSPTSFC